MFKNIKKLCCALIGAATSFIIMFLLNLSSYPQLHYLPEAFEFFLAGVTCGLISREDEELLAVSMVLPAAINYLFNALLVPVCAALACFYYVGVYAGMYLGGENA